MDRILNGYDINECLKQNEIKELINAYNTNIKPSSGNKIVTIGFDKDIKKMISNIINENGKYALIATIEDGKYATKIIDVLKPDIIIMDANLTIINSFKATEDIIKNQPNINILIVSENSSKSTVLEALKSGATNFILKTSCAEMLSSALDEMPQNYEDYYNKIRRPEPIQKLTEQILTKTKIKLIVEIYGERMGFNNGFAQIWKDQNDIYTIVYICWGFYGAMKIFPSTESIKTFDILKEDGELIEKLLAKEDFIKYYYKEVLNGGCTYIIPHIYNNKHFTYSWKPRPKEPEFQMIEDIIYKYIDLEAPCL